MSQDKFEAIANKVISAYMANLNTWGLTELKKAIVEALREAASLGSVRYPSAGMLNHFFDEAYEDDCNTGNGLWQCFDKRLREYMQESKGINEH